MNVDETKLELVPPSFIADLFTSSTFLQSNHDANPSRLLQETPK